MCSRLVDELPGEAKAELRAAHETVTRISDAILAELRADPVRGKAGTLATLNALAIVAAQLCGQDHGLRTYFCAAYEAQVAAQRRGSPATVFGAGH